MTKSERGYTSAGRLITRVLHTLAETYPLNGRFVNADTWDSEGAFVGTISEILLNALQTFKKTTTLNGAVSTGRKMLLLNGTVRQRF